MVVLVVVLLLVFVVVLVVDSGGFFFFFLWIFSYEFVVDGVFTNTWMLDGVACFKN